MFLRIGEFVHTICNSARIYLTGKCRAVEILKHCTATDSVKLLLSRDATAQSGYRRLLDILADADANSTLPANTPKGAHDIIVSHIAVLFSMLQ